jgi:hypothetical protein
MATARASHDGASTGSPNLLHRWRITMVLRKREGLGVVEAINAEAAIKVAIATFGISDLRRQRRLVATRILEEL